MKQYLIAGLLVAGFVTPALAGEFYVAQDSSSHKCSIVSKKPDGTKRIMLGTEGFKTQVGGPFGDEGLLRVQGVSPRYWLLD